MKRKIIPKDNNLNPGTNYKEYKEWEERQISLKKHNKLRNKK